MKVNYVDDFLANGYVKFRTHDSSAHNLFRQTIYETLGRPDLPFENLHMLIDKGDLNKQRLSCFDALNRVKNWETLVYRMAEEPVKQIMGLELSMQNKINFSIQFPHDTSSLVPMHTDRAGGHSLFECVFWTSFTKNSNTSSMFISDYDTTCKILSELRDNELTGINKLQEKYYHSLRFIEVEPGDCILFSSNLYHGNVVNEEEVSRLSFNVRLKPLWAPELKKYPNERVTGSFYSPFKLSPLSEYALRYRRKEPTFDE